LTPIEGRFCKNLRELPLFPITIDNPKVRMANKIYSDKSIEIRDICKTLNISRPTLYRYVNIK